MPPDQALIVVDPMTAGSDPNRFFHYDRIDAEHYVLLGKDTDDRPFTSDDILPDVAIKLESDIGLLLDRKQQTASDVTQ